MVGGLNLSLIDYLRSSAKRVLGFGNPVAGGHCKSWVFQSFNGLTIVGSFLCFVLAMVCGFMYVFPVSRAVVNNYGLSESSDLNYGTPDRTDLSGECNVYDGRWVPDESYPLYNASECPFAERGFNCLANGRKDKGYLKWRWKPKDCDISRFNVEIVLERLRGKRVVFVGDSLSRTQWESMICMLMTGVKDKRSVYEVNGNKITKRIRYLGVRFSSFNFTVEFYRSVFLVQPGPVPKRAPKRVKSTLKLDVLDDISKEWIDSDVLIFNSGHWWTPGKLFGMHLIGFFLFLSLTIYTAMKVPKVVDLNSLQYLPEMLKKADLHKLHSELLACFPSLPNIPDLQRLREELTNSLPSIDLLSSPSTWHIFELLTNCLPERLFHSNRTDVCVLRSVKEDMGNMIAPLMTTPITRWPFFAFLGGAMFCLLASSTCHLLACHSERLSYIMLRLDYAGIAALISTSFYPPVYYSFMCSPFFCNLYLGFITFLGIGTILVSLLPVFQKPEYRVIRASLFLGMGLSGIAPILHKLILFRNRPEALHTTGYELLMGAFYGLGALIYATRIPERWMPGKFDIAGHSHQLFHVLVVAGAYTHYRAGLLYLRWRDVEGC